MIYFMAFFLVVIPSLILIRETTVKEKANLKVTFYVFFVLIIGLNLIKGGAV